MDKQPEKQPDIDPSKNTSNTGLGVVGMSEEQQELLKIGEIGAEIKHEKKRISELKRKLRLENFRRRLKTQTTSATDMVGNFFAALIHSSTTPSEEAVTRKKLQKDMTTRHINGF